MRWVWGVMVVALGLVSACTPAAAPAPTSAAGQGGTTTKPTAPPAAAKELKTIRIGIPQKGSFEAAVPVYIAEEKGLFQAEGLKAQYDFTKGGSEKRATGRRG